MSNSNSFLEKASKRQLQAALQTWLDSECDADSHEREDVVMVCTCTAKKMALALGTKPSNLVEGLDDDVYDDDYELIGTYNDQGVLEKVSD